MTFDTRLNVLFGFAVGMGGAIALRDGLDITRGEVLSFFGSVVGVVGAVYVVIFTRSVERRDRIQPLVTALRALAKASGPNIPMPDNASADPGHRLAWQQGWIEHTAGPVEQLLDGADLRDPVHLFCVKQCRAALALFRQACEAGPEIVIGDPAHHAVMNAEIARMQPYISAISRKADNLRKELDPR